MSTADPRYVRINELWKSLPAIPCSSVEAVAMVKRICNTFGSKTLGGPRMYQKFVTRRVRRVWIDHGAKFELAKGWPRLAHDLSHMINRRRHPTFPPHDNTQARLEWEVSCYVAASLIESHKLVQP